jgi:transcriptional antiterminator RfaH
MFENKNAAWFCLRSQPKHEHIASAHLRKVDGIEVFLPRIRFKRATRRGTAWVTEALFPGYIFARFDWQNSLRSAQSARGVRGVVHFGERWPTIPENTIDELQAAVGSVGVHVIAKEFSPGDAVQIADGTLRGLRAVVARVTSGSERVAVLMEFLGRQTMIELAANSIIKEGNERAAIL